LKDGRILYLKCIKCGVEYPPDKILFFCKKCGSSLDYVLDHDVIADMVSKDLLARRVFNMWRYKEFLPIVDESRIVSIGEGGTPLIKSEKLAERLGLKFLYLKLDCCNPTGSFKDRGASAAISRALERLVLRLLLVIQLVMLVLLKRLMLLVQVWKVLFLFIRLLVWGNLFRQCCMVLWWLGLMELLRMLQI